MDARMDATRVLLPRQSTTDDATSEFLKLIQDPFASQLQSSSIWAALASSVAITAAMAIGFSLIRPYNTVVYAPKLKHADEKHAPPRLGKGVFAWIGPVWKTTEQEVIQLMGMDAAIFLRFTRMCRNLLVTCAIIGCAILVPINYINTTDASNANVTWLTKITPANVWGDVHWATVAVAWLINLSVAGFLWWNYRVVLRLRRQYFESPEYQQSLHARTLMLYDIPKSYSSDEGIARIIDEVVPQSSFSRTAIARDVKILPELIAEHNETVRKLEKVLAKYLKDPQNLPAARPVCHPSKKDRSYGTYPKGQKVDAIEYLTDRIRSLEIEIKEVRQSVDKRSSMGYGFASYADISEAHAIAYTLRKKKPHGAFVHLAPRPNDVIWDNMPLTAATRARRRLWNNMWITILTFLWIAPNAMIAIFLVNLSNLGRLWPAFQTSLSANSGFWAIVQGIASPAVTSIVYLLLPILFRRLSMRAGDQTKTGRERHVAAKLYSFFFFNNLFVFSVFSALWTFISGVLAKTSTGIDAWQAILKQDFGATVFVTLCSISPFWVTWLLQRQLGAAIDLAQLWPLFYSFIMRKLSAPTPRELIELTAPPPFEYASYFNFFLFYTTVTLCYAPIQPLVLPAAAMYFIIDVALKKYLLMYVFVTKTESGGMFWRMLFNRMVFAAVFSDLVYFLVTWVRGNGMHYQAYAVAPLPFLMIGFKIYCASVFDDKIHFFAITNLRRSNPESGMNVKEEGLRSDRLASKFGHPALYKPLITPMVHAKAQNKLASIYQGRLSDGREAGSGDTMSVSGYSDTYVLDSMAAGKPGKMAGLPGFELVPESRLDFEFYKNREEFAAEHGQGDLFGKASDMMRPGTPGTMFSSDSSSRPGTPVGGMGFAGGKTAFGPPPLPLPADVGAGVTYPRGYTSPPQQTTAYIGQTPFSSAPVLAADPLGRTRSPLYSQANDSDSNLMHHAAGMPMSPPVRPETPGSAGSGRIVPPAIGNPRAPGSHFGGSPYGYGGIPQEEDGAQSPTQDPMSYDYFRGARRGVRDVSGPGGATRSGSGSPWGGNLG